MIRKIVPPNTAYDWSIHVLRVVGINATESGEMFMLQNFINDGRRIALKVGTDRVTTMDTERRHLVVGKAATSPNKCSRNEQIKVRKKSGINEIADFALTKVFEEKTSVVVLFEIHGGNAVMTVT